MQQLRAIFTTGSGLSLVLIFVWAGLSAIQSHFTGNISADVGIIVSLLGMILHPTNMVGGKSK